ncbi:beta-galactosidase GalA [Hymenobacter caeli]|uniref:Beta-galactosidase n=1 Tax=Hymenobacter caeli TaxID=2735894 RepID=A0ABX2FL74_9BACT|nr:beta-galactosidase GalA [Hymenobacter caeli]NRT17878.1 beta-galactosidase [Hymenobacter caeli]
MPQRLALVLLLLGALLGPSVKAGAQAPPPAAAPGREHLLMDFGWRFAYGHPFDPAQDFGFGLGYFSYLAKTGNGDGAAAPGFDDRGWRRLDLPHDWAAEQPFSPDGSPEGGFSHGFKTVGRSFPKSSVGWYRKTFAVPATDLGRHLALEFDGVFRNSQVWINGHYLGTEPSGYYSFHYDITDYLNYGGPNVVAVRVDATLQEGWFYEGAGIYRHTWLTKTALVHVAPNGTFVSTEPAGPAGAGARVTARATIANDGRSAQTVEVVQEVQDAAGRAVATGPAQALRLAPYQTQVVRTALPLALAHRWGLTDPYLYKLVTRVRQGGAEVDAYPTAFGVRTLRFDPNQGFFLNDAHVELKGTNNHQDHAGVGTALPDALQEFRIRTLKSFGINAYRCSHNPPAPELLDACDQLGMLVIDEAREMGSSELFRHDARRLVERDRNHPSVILWSIGNEEWAVEGNITGARLAASAQAAVKAQDSTRAVTAAVSGGWGQGISTVTEVMGYNYISQGSTDAQHAKFPLQSGVGTEEGSTYATRGVYLPDSTQLYRVAYDRKGNGNGSTLEQGWQHYAARPYLAGMFIWTGFDYRGEATPNRWPANVSYFGMLDLCGFPKDDAYYLRAWWGAQPSLHLLPHWTWPGHEGQPFDVWAYANCEEVELFLNSKSLGRKPVPANSHVAWAVPYAPGTLRAVGYRAGRAVLTDEVRTAGPAAALRLSADQPALLANREDVAVVSVRVEDAKHLLMPTANADVTFALSGPGRIIGVGNGDETSLEADKFLGRDETVPLENLRELALPGPAAPPEVTAATYDDAAWAPAFGKAPVANTAYAYRGSFTLPAAGPGPAATAELLFRNLGEQQSVYVNGQLLGQQLAANGSRGYTFPLDAKLLRPGRNSVVIIARPFIRQHNWDNLNTNPGAVSLRTPAPAWHRRAFNGLAQVLVQATGAPGPLVLTATAPGLRPARLALPVHPAAPRPAVE